MGPDVAVPGDTFRLDLGHNGVVETTGTLQRAPQGVDARTRDRVARLLLELGPSTAAELGKRLSLSPAAIRRHLDTMLTTGTITTRAVRSTRPRGRGRPARAYALTAAGHAAGPSAYDDLAVSALRFLNEKAGPAAVDAFATDRAEQLADRLTNRLPSTVAGPALVSALAGALTDEGYAATVHEVATGTQLCQHHCPVASVAGEFPALCDAETAVLSRLLDTHVQRLATIAHGDGVCTLHVPLPSSAASPASPAVATSPTTAPAAAGAPAAPRKGSA